MGERIPCVGDILHYCDAFDRKSSLHDWYFRGAYLFVVLLQIGGWKLKFLWSNYERPLQFGWYCEGKSKAKAFIKWRTRDKSLWYSAPMS